MPVLELEFEVFCSCGRGLCNDTEEGRPYGNMGSGTAITVEPCQSCLDEARSEGDYEGYQRGLQEGNQ